MNKTINPSIDSINHQWYLVDAENQTLGRLATEVAAVLRGKNKPYFTPHLDTGDFVVIVNAEKIQVTGRKGSQKLYRRHSGRPGGMKVETFNSLQERIPERIVEKAPPGEKYEDMIKSLKKKYPGDNEKIYSIAWAQYNKDNGK